MIKTEGGHKRGHSNMAHWDTSRELKKMSRKARRKAGKRLCKMEQREFC